MLLLTNSTQHLENSLRILRPRNISLLSFTLYSPLSLSLPQPPSLSFLSLSALHPINSGVKYFIKRSVITKANTRVWKREMDCLEDDPASIDDDRMVRCHLQASVAPAAPVTIQTSRQNRVKSNK